MQRRALRRRLETSNSPVVSKLLDLRDAMKVEETEQAAALRIIRSRQPDFDMHELRASVRQMIPVVIGAYLRGDVGALRAAAVAPEMLERLGAMVGVWTREGAVMDSQILDVSELEGVEVKLMGPEEPIVIFQFSIQQINCVRDKYGNITEARAPPPRASGRRRSPRLGGGRARRTTSSPSTMCGRCSRRWTRRHTRRCGACARWR